MHAPTSVQPAYEQQPPYGGQSGYDQSSVRSARWRASSFYQQPGYGQSDPNAGQGYYQQPGYGQPGSQRGPGLLPAARVRLAGYSSAGRPGLRPASGIRSAARCSTGHSQPYGQAAGRSPASSNPVTAATAPGGPSSGGFAATGEAPKKSNQGLIIAIVVVVVLAALAAVALFVWPGYLNKKVFDERRSPRA